MMKKNLCSIFVVLLMFFANSLLAEEGSPTIINAERLEVKLDEGRAIFTGAVKAVQAGGVLECQELQVIFDKDTENEGIEKLIAKGKVRISQRNSLGLCEEAIYEFTPKEKITLKGNPHLSQGKQKFSGETIVFLIDEQKIIIKQKVKGVIFPQKGERWNN